MATRSLNVVISGDARQLGIASKDAGKHLSTVEGSAHRMGKAVALGFAAAGAAAAGALVIGLKKSADAAIDAEKSQAKLRAQLKASGIDYRAHAKEIDAVIQKHSRLAGIDDEDLQDAFTNLVRSTGSVSKSMHDMGLVTDIARAKHIDVTKAAELLGKVHAGNVGVLKRYGIAFDPVTKAQDKLKESNQKATVEQVKAAKAADKQATSQKALAELQKRFGGQAEAYGKTAAGAQERFSVAVENVQEKLGKFLLPVLAKVANAVSKFLQGIDSGTGVGGRFAAVIGRIGSVVGSAISAVVNFGKRVVSAFQSGDGSAGQFSATVRRIVTQVIGFVTNLYKRVHDVFSGSGIGGDLATIGRAFLKFLEIVQSAINPILRRVLPALSGAITGLATVIRGIVRIIAGILSGDWGKAWDGAKDVARGGVKAIGSIVKGMAGLLLDAAKAGGKAIGNGILSGLGSLGHLLLQKVKDAVGFVTGAVKNIGGAIGKALSPFGDGIGKPSGDGLGMLFPSVGGFTGGLHGASASMAPFASLGAGFGLRVSSGRDDHSRMTSSGNVSYHASGHAIDEAGPMPAMHRYAQTLFSRFGGRLRELISPWPELGIKDGHPFRYSGAIQAQHSGANAHVHVAYLPPSGDGIGFTGLEHLWVQGGGSAKLAPLMAHVAQAESGGDPHARNPSGASGLWQILGQPFAGNVFDPLTNAKMAVWKYQHQGLGAWAASRGSWGKYVGSNETYSGGGSSGGGSGGGSSSSGSGARGAFNTSQSAARKTVAAQVKQAASLQTPQQAAGTYQGGLDAAELSRAEAGSDPHKILHAVMGEIKLKLDRLTKVRKALKRRLTAATRSRLVQEATTLIGELADLWDVAQANGAKGAPPKGVVPNPPTADAGSSSSGDAGGGGVDTGGGTVSTEPDPQVQAAIDAQNALAQALKDVKASIDANTDYAKSVGATNNFQLTKTLADLLSGQIVGYGVAGRAFTPGVGTAYSY